MHIGALLLFLSVSLGAPLSGPGGGGDNILPAFTSRQLPECGISPGRNRTDQDIVLSCLVTIFACTWVAVHPNIPGIWDSWWEKTKRKLVMMIYAVLAPEFIAFLAVRQWTGAGRIAREFNEKYGMSGKTPAPKGFGASIKDTVTKCFTGPRRVLPTGWTRTHGFFVQMGGFMLYQDRTPIRVLQFDELMEMIAKGEVDVPDITEDEINNMSKGDLLTKLIVVLQTTWFSFQCLTRWATHLPVTDLEVVTLAFAALNVIIYAMWWKKPQNVLVAVRIQHKLGQGINHGGSSMAADAGEMKESLRGGEAKDQSWFKVQALEEGGWFVRLIRVPPKLLMVLVRPLFKMAGDDVVHGIGVGSRKVVLLRVPMFFADNPNQVRDTIPISAIGVLFGAIHLIPWMSFFPSNAELWLWRSSALVITVEPLMLLSTNAVPTDRNNRYEVPKSSFWVVFSLAGLAASLYVLARLILLAVALTTLRSLPQDTYKAIEWTTFVPHL